MKRVTSPLSAALVPTALAVLLSAGLLVPSTARAASAAPSIASLAVPSAASLTPVALANQHLADEMDKYNKTFDVYTDLDAGGNHFVTRAMMGGDVAFDDSSTVVYRGRTSLRGTFTPSNSSSWGGWYLMNGVLLGSASAPSANWGTTPDAGYDLTGATQLTFWARGAVGGERVEFFAFGVGRNATSGVAIAAYPDSEAKVTLCGRLVSPCWTALSASWTKYTISLSGLDLHYVLGGFGWVAKAAENATQPIAFYMDDVQFDKPHLSDLRFITSYVTTPSGVDFDNVLENTAFSYDNAVALLAFTAGRDWSRASEIADAFVYAQDHDRYYTDGRIRNAYQSGDLEAPPGWTPHGLVGTARMPGWTDTGNWFEDSGSVGSGTGNTAWVMIALLRYYESRGGSQYLQAAIDLGTWVETETRDARCQGGYKGGFDGEEPTPTPLTWKSTEHNIDLWVAFSLLHRATGDSVWQTRAAYARTFVESMWNDTDGYYRTGTGDDGCTANTQAIPLDAQSWSLLAFGSNSRTLRGISYVEGHHEVCSGSFCGFDFNEDRDMPWPEGTAQMVDAYWALSRTTDATTYLADLAALQATGQNGNGKGVVAAPADGLTTGFTWLYYDRLHIGATAWFVLAELKYDPLTLETLVVAPAGSTVAAGAGKAYTAEGFDSNGDSIGDVTSTTTFTISGSGSCTGAVCSATSPGTHTVTATHGAAQDTATLHVTPGAARTLKVAVAVNPWLAGAKHSVTVTAKDAYGNTATGYRGRVHFTSSDTQASVPADYTFTSGDNGVHAFASTLSPALTLKTAGSRSVTATDKSKTSIKGSQTVTVTPGAAKTLEVSGILDPFPAGSTHSFKVTARDAYGNVATGYTGTIHFTTSDTQGSVPADYKFTSGDKGVHTFANTLKPGLTLKTPGRRWVRATDKSKSSITGSQTVTVS